LRTLLAFLLLAAPAAFDFSPARTTVAFTLDSTLHTVHGTFAWKHGTLRLDTATGTADGELVVDATSAQSGDDGRDKKMRSEILETAKYPEITFRPDRMEGALAPTGKSSIKLHGVFSIHGGKHEMTVPVDVTGTAGGYDATARFEIPYIEWGMKNPSTLFLRASKTVVVIVHTLVSPS
jgi:polyisoprenoid-binding protein YceI